MSRSTRARRDGFTLVELLVVIVVIAMLVGLLVPAINAAREAARQGVCMNNQKEVATAIQQYIAAKDRFPGYRNFSAVINPGPPPTVYSVSWATVLFPYLGRMDLWREWRGSNGTPAPSTPLMDQLLCPDDDVTSADAPLSFVASRNIFRDREFAGPVNYNSTNDVSPDDIESNQITPMISEKLSYDMLYPSATADTGGRRQWDFTGRVEAPAPLSVANYMPETGFVFDTDPTDTYHTFGVHLSSGHPNLVIVTFCDGHSEKIRLDTICEPNLYHAGPPLP